MMGTPEFKVGLFVTVCIALTIMMSLKVNVDPSVAGKTKDYILVLPDAQGLVKNAQVKMAGIPIGVIHNIELQDVKAKLYLKLQGDIKLTQSATAELRPNGMLGDKYIELNPGNPNDPPLSDGGTIAKFKASGGLDAMMGQVGQMANDMSEITRTLKEVTTGTGSQNTPFAKILNNIEQLTADLKDVSGAKKDKIEDIVDNMEGITKTLNQFMTDEGDDGFKENWKKMTASLGRVDNILKNFDEAATKINKGEGTIGKLINDETTVTELNQAITGVNTMMSAASKIQLDMDFRNEVQANFMSKTYVGVALRPGPDRYYLAQLVDDPRGALEVVNADTAVNNGVPTNTSTKTVYKNRFKFSAQYAKTFYSLTARIGVFENSGGVALDFSPFKRFRLSTELFGLGRTEGAYLRAYARYNIFSVFYLTAGGDDILNTRGNPLTGTGASGFIGAGLDFTNDDLKLFLTKGL